MVFMVMQDFYKAPTSQWQDVDVGLGFTVFTTGGNVGVGQ